MKQKINCKKGILYLLVCLIIFTVTFNTYSFKIDAASNNVSVLIKNLGGSTSPLLEYSDPISYAEQYSKRISGKVELFLVNWSVSNLVTTKNKKWKESYEQELLTLLSDNTITKACLDSSSTEYVEAIDTAVSDICEALQVEISEEFGSIAIASKILDASLRYTMKQELKKSQAKMQILALIASNTDDKNLQAACKSCINTVNTTTFNNLNSEIINKALEIGLSEVKAKSIVKNQILKTSLSGLSTKTLTLLGECAKGFSYSLVILDAKDILCLFTGVKSRTDNYMGIVSDEIIYHGTLNSFQKVLSQYKNGDSDQAPVIEMLFHTMLETKKNEYTSVPKMLSSSAWSKALNEDSSLKEHNNKIKSITITNYKKSAIVSQKASIKLNKSSASIYINKSLKLKATVTGKNKTVTWKSSNSKIATVNSSGKVIGKKAGTVTITAKANGKTAKCKVTVKSPSIKLNKTSATIYTSGTTSVQLKATVKGASKKVTWKSSNDKIATVKKGKVTAKKAGKVIITAKANGKTAKCTISVKKVKATQNKILSKKEQHKLYESTISSYSKLMKKGAIKWDESTNLETYFTFVDIDKNGIDELIVRAESSYWNEHTTASNSGYGENTNIYTISNNKVKKVFGNSTYSPTLGHNNYVHIYKNCKYVDRGFSHLPHDYIFYKYKNGVLSSKPTYTFTVGGTGTWSVNGKSVSQNYCMNQLRKVSGEREGYQMYKYTVSTYRNYI